MTDTRNQSDLPTAVDMLDSVLVLITVAGLILLSVAVLAPLVVAALLISLVAAIVAIPYLLIRKAFAARKAVEEREASAPKLGSALTPARRATVRS